MVQREEIQSVRENKRKEEKKEREREILTKSQTDR